MIEGLALGTAVPELVQHNLVLPSIARHSTAWRSMAQHAMAWHNIQEKQEKCFAQPTIFIRDILVVALSRREGFEFGVSMKPH